jgi:hypothetical protein
MLASFIVVTALSATFAEHAIKAAGSATVAFLFIFFAFYDIAFTPLSIAYPVEILPFSLRAKGLAVNLTTVFGAGCMFDPIAFHPLSLKSNLSSQFSTNSATQLHSKPSPGNSTSSTSVLSQP